MGSYIETNDMLSLNENTGFPEALDYEKYKLGLCDVSGIEDRMFSFSNKSGIRIYKVPPLRNVLVQNTAGGWIHWGLVEVLEVVHNYQETQTSGTFKIVKLFTPGEIEAAKLYYENSSGS